MMAVPREHLTNHLRVIEGGWKREEARIEAIAFFDEAEASAMRIIDAIVALPVPSTVAIDEAGRIAYRARAARAEIIALTRPDGVA